LTFHPNITIYGKPACQYCVQAKSFLERRHIPYEYVDIFDNPTDEQRNVVNGIIATGYRSMPMIFINGEFIGGYSELEKRSFE
jgi:glutaredoxin